jgi:PAS domain S-box-containing protein
VVNAAVRDEDGEFLFAFGMVSDIAEQKHAASQLEESLRAYRGLFESSPIGIVIEDEARQILSCNPAFARMTALAVDDVLGKNLLEFTLKPATDTNPSTFDRILAGELDYSQSER